MGERENQVKQDGLWVGTGWRRGTWVDGGSLHHSVCSLHWLLQYISAISRNRKHFWRISHLAFSSPNTFSHLKKRFSAAKLVIIHTWTQNYIPYKISTHLISKYFQSLLKVPFTGFDAPSKKHNESLAGRRLGAAAPSCVCVRSPHPPRGDHGGQHHPRSTGEEMEPETE